MGNQKTLMGFYKVPLLFIIFFLLGHTPFFFRLTSNAFSDVGTVSRIEKKNLKKKHQKSRLYPRMTFNIHIFELTKCTIYRKNRSCFCSCFSLCQTVTKLIFQIKRIISREKWFNYVVTIFFVLKMPKIWVGDDAKRRKKRGCMA